MSEKVTAALVRLQRITEEVELLLGQEIEQLQETLYLNSDWRVGAPIPQRLIDRCPILPHLQGGHWWGTFLK